MARGEGFYCSDPWCDGDHPLPSMTCEDERGEPIHGFATEAEHEDAVLADLCRTCHNDGTEHICHDPDCYGQKDDCAYKHHVEPPC